MWTVKISLFSRHSYKLLSHSRSTETQTAKATLLYSQSYLLLSHCRPAGTQTAKTSLLSSNSYKPLTHQGKYKKGKTTTHFMIEQRVIRPQQYSMQGLVVIPDPLSGTQTTSTYADIPRNSVTL